MILVFPKGYCEGGVSGNIAGDTPCNWQGQGRRADKYGAFREGFALTPPTWTASVQSQAQLETLKVSG